MSTENLRYGNLGKPDLRRRGGYADFSSNDSKSDTPGDDKACDGYPAEVEAVTMDTAEPNYGVFQQMYARMKSRTLSLVLCGASIVGALASTGCQVSVGGQTLPSPYYLKDDIQYFPKGSEFKLSREAAAQKEARARDQLNR